MHMATGHENATVRDFVQAFVADVSVRNQGPRIRFEERIRPGAGAIAGIDGGSVGWQAVGEMGAPGAALRCVNSGGAGQGGPEGPY